MEKLTINTSLYTAETTGSSSASESGENQGRRTNMALRRLKLNEFLTVSGRNSVRQPKKKWEQLSSRTKKSRILQARDGVVAVLEVIAPEAESVLWEDLKESLCIEQALNSDTMRLSYDEKYLKALAEAYENAESWDTRRQILSIMADLAPYHVIQRYIPGITEYRIKIARHHGLQYGRGSSLPITKSPRIRVDSSKLDHFISFITSSHIVQDLPFGQRYLHLSSGKVIETPNTIRMMIPQRIIQQYRQFCEETNVTPFSESTLIRILSSCAATVRKSLQGLDYFAADGAKAFDDLRTIILKLGETDGVDRQWMDKTEQALMAGKQYLKTDYKVHIAEASDIADHCITYALSDPKQKPLCKSCDHLHDQSCPSCDQLKSAMKEIKVQLLSTKITDEERDSILFSYQQAVQAIESWKAHQLRSIQQDKARTHRLEDLDSTSVLITQDWAMKFIPQKYRETQTDWFGKRGLSWHISVVVRRMAGKLQHQVFVHIIQKCNQESEVVVAILNHTLQNLKREHPEISIAYLRQDNAGCYHSVATLSACRLMKEATGIEVKRVDFSDPQGGKGACDRKAATIKAHVRRYVNEGNDVTTVADFKNAMLSSGGINGVRVALVENLDLQDLVSTQGKWDGISTLNNFLFKEEEVIVWRAFEVGNGKTIPWSTLQVKSSLKSSLVSDISFSPGDFVEVRNSSTKLVEEQRNPEASKIQGEKTEEEEEEEEGETEESYHEKALFSCPNEGCVSMFQLHHNLEYHLLYGKCKLAKERLNLLDKAKIVYAEKLQEGSGTLPLIAGPAVPKANDAEVMPMGWALKSAKKGSRFNENQKQYLDEKFKIGQQTGHKADPVQVSQDMRHAKNEVGVRRFEINEFLTAQQIQSYFSRKAAKLRQDAHDSKSSDQEMQEQDDFVKDQASYSRTRSIVVQECQIIHPITFDTYNICEMHAKNKMKNLNIAMLRLICSQFDLDIENLPERRKAPYIKLLAELVSECSCTRD